MGFGFLFGEQIVIHTRTIAGHDRDNSPIYTDTPTTVNGCAVWPRASTENVQGQDTTIDGLTVLAPAGTTVAATDTVTARGALYDVTGDVGQYHNPFTGFDVVEIQLTRATG